MNAGQAIKTILERQGKTQKDIAKLTGRKQSNICDTLKSDMRLSTFAEIVAACGYEITLTRKADEIKITK